MTNTFECGWKAHYTSMTLHSAAQCNEVKKCEIFNKLRLVFLTDKFFCKTRYSICVRFFIFLLLGQNLTVSKSAEKSISKIDE